MGRTNANHKSGNRQLRIIGGKWRSRRIGFPDSPGLRPTGDRIRETLFNWLTPYLPGARCIDAFAGSGALGFEALSRGAGHVSFIDIEAIACKSLSTNCISLDADNAEVVNDSFFLWLNTQQPQSADIVFIDPPFDAQLQNRALSALESSGVLDKDGIIYVESPITEPLEVPTPWRSLREKTTSTLRYQLLSMD